MSSVPPFIDLDLESGVAFLARVRFLRQASRLVQPLTMSVCRILALCNHYQAYRCLVVAIAQASAICFCLLHYRLLSAGRECCEGLLGLPAKDGFPPFKVLRVADGIAFTGDSVIPHCIFTALLGGDLSPWH